ncbi:serine/threonine-protein kinase [Mesorhizobium sp. M1050]|uniref:serine/threonine-protein kinase n=1 Tax=Mesorhizobium sp. M1050 TaxID=2957051 RepID=UPI003337A269
MNGPLTADTPPIGGRYQTKSWINAGGMQHVYLAEDKLFGREVALKTPKDDAGAKRFRQSAVVSAKVNQENVAKTLDYLEEPDGRAFLVEELVHGADLETVMSIYLPFLPPTTCARLMHQLAKGLAASHSAKVVHRDLKPSNIMIVGGWKFEGAKITDFGIAKLAEDEIGAWAGSQGTTQSKTVLGAIPYMSPESINDFKVATMPSDVWSIAAIIYRLLSGAPPFGTGLKSIPKIIDAVAPELPQQVRPVQFLELGRQLFEIVISCLNKDPSKRPTAEELVKHCEALCYSLDPYELGVISKLNNSATGFIHADHGKDLMYHKANFYGGGGVSVGKRIWFARAPGLGNDRAFPIVYLNTKK